MKRLIKFSNLFIPMVILSSAIIISGVVGIFTQGINLGIDFQAGFIQKVAIAPTAFSMTYSGSKAVTVEQTSTGIEIVATGVVSSDNQTYSFPYAQFSTVADFAQAVMGSVPGVLVQVVADSTVPLNAIFPDSESLSRLSSVPYRFHFVPVNASIISSDDVRSALSSISDASIQVVGKPEERTFQIRLKDDGSDPDASINLRASLSKALVAAYGADSIAVLSIDFVGSRFSSSLASQAIWLLLATLALIWVYATIRFRWDFALGAVLAISHDALLILAFIVWTKMQFNTTTLAAILTIIGYSINDTIVVFDRIRENIKFHEGKTITEILDISQTEVLGRTIITTVTTMLAVSALYIFTTGDMKNFALALLVGMTSGVYSTIYIASSFISFVSRFRKDKGLLRDKTIARTAHAGEVV